ncbi:ROK family transcriptional regulator [Paenibacillus psychroresistens]|nr:ROK family protein [Paenibacillus psychroresistens]
MKALNRTAILQLFHSKGTLTRVEIAKLANLTPTTVSSQVDGLVNEGFLDELGKTDSNSVGRKAIKLEITRSKGYIIVVCLSAQSFTCSLVNFHGEIIEEIHSPSKAGNKSACDFIEDGIPRLMKIAKVKKIEKIKGISVVSPGIIDEQNGVIKFSRVLEIHDLQIKKILEDKYKFNIEVINDMNASVFAEHYYGLNNVYKNLLYISIEEGIGSGIIINEQIYSGFNGSAGEIGHTCVDPDGITCSCGNKGCIETILTIPFILLRAQEAAQAASDAVVPENFDDVISMYEQGAEWIQPIMEQALQVMSQTFALLFNFLSPEILIVNGWPTRSEKFVQEMKKKLEEFPFPTPNSSSRIVFKKLEHNQMIIGAAIWLFQGLFSGTLFSKRHTSLDEEFLNHLEK